MGLLEVSCVDPDTHISAGGIGIGIFLAVAALFANVPQGLKIIRLNSSNGLSPTTMACVVVHNVLVLADMVVVKWRILQSCAGAAGHCLFRLLDCIQQSGTVLTQALILGLFTMYPPNCVARYRAVALLTTLFAAALVTASAVASLSDPCSSSLLAAAEAYSLSASAVVVVAYMPQLIKTWRTGGAKSLSYATTGIQALGALAISLNFLIFQHDPWVSWAPNMVASVMQFAILGVAYRFDTQQPQVVGAEGLLDNPLSENISARWTVEEDLHRITSPMKRLSEASFRRISRMSGMSNEVTPAPTPQRAPTYSRTRVAPRHGDADRENVRSRGSSSCEASATQSREVTMADDWPNSGLGPSSTQPSDPRPTEEETRRCVVS
ncbi:hypothetical protein AB1Y20_006884 [Prymnesium parvum]|uniref:Sugar transporter SWEET1 n=1 Tax=Prymnesium parvum TaxID=97485 RepID=A0AB34IYV6_PRYPA